jgi:phospholipid/cholesterol/gamma-HCH transport system permease protein
MTRWFEGIGKSFFALLSYIGGVMSLFAFSFQEVFAGKKKAGSRLINQIIIKQIFFTGYQALGTIGIVALALGFIIIVQMVSIASMIGASDIIGKVLITVIVRELGPVLTAIILIGRSGTAIAAEIGNMMASDEFDSLESIGIDPLRYIVYPRIVAMIVSLMGLVIFFDVIGLLGGYLAAYLFGLSMPFEDYINNIFSAMSPTDLLVVALKTFTMGGAIAVMSVMEGFKVGRTARLVPVAASRAVVNSLIAVFLMDGVITVFSYI